MRRVWCALLVTGAIALAGCSGSASKTDRDDASTASTVGAAPSGTPSPTASAIKSPSAEPARVPGTFMLGETATGFADGTLTVTSVEVVPEIATNDGGVVTAADGEQLVVIRTHFTNAGPSTVDLSCSGVPNWYIQVFDTEQRELAQVFESYRIPGNPECNYQLMSGQESDWTLIFRSIAGATPRVFQITDSRTFDDWIAWALTDEPLRLAEG